MIKTIAVEDNVNHPRHYADTCSLECIDVMKLVLGRNLTFGFCLGNAFKYMWRFKNKNGQEDLKKSRWYLNTATGLGFIEEQRELHTRLSDLLNVLEDQEGE